MFPAPYHVLLVSIWPTYSWNSKDMDDIIPNSVSEDTTIMAFGEHMILSSASSQDDITSLSSKSSSKSSRDNSRENKSPQTLLEQRQTLACKRMKLEESNIKMEEDFAFKATQERQKHLQRIRQNELALEGVALGVKANLLEAAKEASKKEAKTLQESKNSDHQARLAKAYQQYQEELVQVEQHFALNPWRKGKVSVPKIAHEHVIDPKTLLKYVILFF